LHIFHVFDFGNVLPLEDERWNRYLIETHKRRKHSYILSKIIAIPKSGDLRQTLYAAYSFKIASVNTT